MADQGYQYYADFPCCESCGDVLEPREYVSGLCVRCADNWIEIQEDDE